MAYVTLPSKVESDLVAIAQSKTGRREGGRDCEANNTAMSGGWKPVHK